MSRYFTGLWRHYDFLKLWGGQSFSAFGSLVSRIALPFLVIYTLNATPAQVSWVRVADLAPGMLAGLVAGVWIDRLRRRPVMIWADLGRALLIGSIPLAFWLGRVTLWQIIILNAATSILTVIFDVSYEAYLPTLVESEHVVEANSKLAATGSIAEVTGFSLAGALFQLLGGAAALAIDALSFAVSALTLFLIRKPEESPRPSGAHESVFREAGAGLRVLGSNSVLLVLAGASGLDSLFGGFMETCYVLFVSRQLHVSPTIQGVLYGLGGISSFAGAALARPALSRLGLGKTLLVTSALGLIGITLVPLAAFVPMWTVILFLVLQQLIGDGPATLYHVQVTSLRQTITARSFQGRVNATWRVSGWLFELVGVLVAGLLAQSMGLLATFFLAVCLRALQLPLLYFSPVNRIQAMPVAAD